ncbi:LytR/AlgR family response regulator transcription factor [Sporomusa malonica]|uniref:Two component transcriptional regulator, LytTR family n=1 Tax=Sporomusa malonica TaxID=112901 RepID=A0A1W2DQ92_9FIRM|nr:LytTR family DNA-binding domain-containing protein [Sporomusa malonica]SMC99192.1 two component transcriptional regulator, LytTR family [Sporomusa malonica]
MLKAIIVDDELPARDELKFLLSKLPGITVVGEADNGPAAVGLAAQHRPDVVFLDIQMRGMSGVDTALALRTATPNSLIVFATAYDEYAIKAFEVGAIDYLLKPFDGERVAAAAERLQKYYPEDWQAAATRIDQAITTAAKPPVYKLAAEKNGKIVLVNYSDMIYAHTQTGSVTVVAETGEYCYAGTLSELQERLRGTTILRVHKSYLVHMEKVKEVIPWFKGTYWLKLPTPGGNTIEVPVGKGQIKDIKELLGLK